MNFLRLEISRVYYLSKSLAQNLVSAVDLSRLEVRYYIKTRHIDWSAIQLFRYRLTRYLAKHCHCHTTYSCCYGGWNLELHP